MSFIKAKPVATYDFYGVIHKAIRLAQSQLVVRLGACGGDDPAELSAVLDDLAGFLCLAEHHLANEDLHVHTALEARAPGSTVRLVQDHAHHRETFEELETLIVRAHNADAQDLGKALRDLYLRFTRYVADDFTHMAEEELLMLPILQSLFTDEELAGIEHTIRGALSPDELMGFGRLIVPAVPRADRIALMSGIRAAAPPEAFEALMNVAARPTLSEADFAHLSHGLGLAPPRAA